MNELEIALKKRTEFISDFITDLSMEVQKEVESDKILDLKSIGGIMSNKIDELLEVMDIKKINILFARQSIIQELVDNKKLRNKIEENVEKNNNWFSDISNILIDIRLSISSCPDDNKIDLEISNTLKFKLKTSLLKLTRLSKSIDNFIMENNNIMNLN